MTRDEVAQHCIERDCWVILAGKVFDVTEFIHHHPGSKELILQFAGADATEAFMQAHSYVSYSEVLRYEQVGVLAGGTHTFPRACFMHLE